MVLQPLNNFCTTGKCNIYGWVSICCYLFIIIAQTGDYHFVLFRINTYAWLLSLYIVFGYVLFSTFPFTQAKVKIKGKAVLHRTVTAYCLLWGVVELSVDVI
jgi:hypothetical protein